MKASKLADSTLQESEDLETEYDSTDSEADEELQQEVFVENYTDVVYNSQGMQDDINYDKYAYSVAKKYDLTLRNLAYKKIKYVTDEIFLDVRWRQRHTIQF